MRRSTIIAAALCLALFALSACSDDEDPLRFVRASGHVRDGAGMPIQDSVVKIQEWTGTEYVDREFQNTSATGAFNIRYENSNSTLGPVRLSAIATGFLEGILDLQPGENNGLTVTLDPQP